jgi:hypothetical protein
MYLPGCCGISCPPYAPYILDGKPLPTEGVFEDENKAVGLARACRVNVGGRYWAAPAVSRRSVSNSVGGSRDEKPGSYSLIEVCV